MATSAAAEASDGQLPSERIQRPVEDVSINAQRAFVGRNATYYDERFRWMDWKGTNRSWNWAAALSLGAWFAYRRLNILTCFYVAWICLAVFAAVKGFPIGLLVVAQIGLTIAFGLYANAIYFRRFRSALARVEGLDATANEREAALEQAGHTSPASVIAMAGVAAGLVALLVSSAGDGMYLRWM